MKDPVNGIAPAKSLPSWLLPRLSSEELNILLTIEHIGNTPVSVSQLSEFTGVPENWIAPWLPEMLRKGLLFEVVGHGEPVYQSRAWHLDLLRKEKNRERLERHAHKHGQWANAVVSMSLLKACTHRKGTVFVYAVLQFMEAPSVAEIAKACCMSVDCVRSSLKWLEAEGWIERIERPGETSLFRVFYQRLGADRG